jgi:hypothetical protein
MIMTVPLKRSMDSTRRDLVSGFGVAFTTGVWAGVVKLVLALAVVDIVKQVLTE